MSTSRLKPISTEKLIFWSVSILLLLQMGWWISVQIRESKRLQEARIAQMRAGRAEAWQMDSMVFLRIELPRDPSEGPGVVVGRLPDSKSMEERAKIIEQRYPYVSVSPVQIEPDDPVLLADQPAYLTMRQEVLQSLDWERTKALWGTAGEAGVMVVAVLLGMGYIYRKLNMGMELMLRQRNFVAAVTHELKTPIASLRVWLDTLFDRELDEERRRRIQDLTNNDLQRLSELVQNLLDTARAEAGGLEVHPEPVELEAWLRSVCEAMDHRLGSGLLGLKLDLVSDIWANIDPKAFSTVIENLLSNAFKYANEPRETLVTLEEEGDDVLITVSDQGHGIHPKALPHLFQRFYRVGNEMTRSVSGTGLGLFLSREIVARHHGQLRAASLGPGLGSTFTIKLPRLIRSA